jgi:ATP-binding cassette subfamily B protein
MIKLPKSLLHFFFYFVKKQPIAFSFLFLAPLAVILEINVIPYALKMLIDAVVSYQDDKSLIAKEMFQALWIGSFAWIVLIAILRVQHWWQAYVIPNFEADIRISVLESSILHSYNYFTNRQTGNIANKISDIPRAIEAIRGIIYWNGVPIFAIILVALVMMSTINPIFAWILGVWVFAHLATTFYFVKFVNQASKKNAEDKSILNGSIVDTISNIMSVKLFARTTYELIYAKEKQEQEKASNTRLIVTMNCFQLCIDILVTLMLGSTVYFLILGWQGGTISAGDFVFIFNTAFAVMNQMWHFGKALADLFRDIGVAEQALELISIPHQITDSIGAKPISVTNGIISFDDVTFCYNKGDNILKNINVTITRGQKVGLVGFSGSGKSTFVNLILRLFDVQSGVIKIDDLDISKVTQDSLHENISMIPQDISLFHRTLIENIRYGRIDATDEEVIAVAKRAYAHDFITQLPHKYNSLVGERGVKLSGGQRQRIAIARAMLKDAPIVILDESTSALDSLTEKHIQESLGCLMYGKTAIVIAHRLSTLYKMDRILVFDRGRIVEDGTHQDLLKAKGNYALIWKMQADGFF